MGKSQAKTKRAERERAKAERQKKIAKRYRDSDKRRELRRRRGAERTMALLLSLLAIGGALSVLVWLLW